MFLQIEAGGTHAAGLAFTAVLAAVGDVVFVECAMAAHMGRKRGFKQGDVVVIVHVGI